MMLDRIAGLLLILWADYDPFWNVKDRINELKLTTPKFITYVKNTRDFSHEMN